MQPLNRPKHATPKSIVDLTISSPIVAPIPTSSILTGAFHALDSVTKNNNNTPNNTNTNINSHFNPPTFYKRNSTTNSHTSTIHSIPQQLPPTNRPFIIQNSRNTPNTNTKPKPTQTPHHPFTSGVVDRVSFNYDANRLKNNQLHTIFDNKWTKEITQLIANDTFTNNTSKIKSSPLNPYKVLNAPRLKFESQITNEGIINYNEYNLFAQDEKKQSVIYKLFHPSYPHGIKDAHLFNHISRNILQLHCVGDIGIDLLNFLHSLFIILYWNDRHFKLQINETPMHGILKVLQDLVPLQTCVWWLNLHHSLNRINEKSTLPNIDFKNILNKQTEKNIFYSNLIKRLMSSGEQQAITWKDYLLQSQSNRNKFLFDEKRRRMMQITRNDNDIVPFNKQLKNYIEQLLLPTLIRRVGEITDRLEKVLIHSNRVTQRSLKSRQYLAKNIASYFSDNYQDTEDDTDDDVILMGDNKSTSSATSSTPRTSPIQPRSFLMNQNERIQLSFDKYEELQKQAKRDRHRNKKKRKHSNKNRKKHRYNTEDTMTNTEDEDINIKGQRKRKRYDSDFDPNEKEKVETRGRKKKIVNDGPRKKRRKKQSVVYNNILIDDQETEEEDTVELSKDGTICIDFKRKHIDNFLKCGICDKCLGASILTINECMDSFCEACLNGYFAKCVKDNIMPTCPKCHHDLGQGSINSIRQRTCKEDKMKMSLIELIAGAKLVEKLQVK